MASRKKVKVAERLADASPGDLVIVQNGTTYFGAEVGFFMNGRAAAAVRPCADPWSIVAMSAGAPVLWHAPREWSSSKEGTGTGDPLLDNHSKYSGPLFDGHPPNDGHPMSPHPHSDEATPLFELEEFFRKF